MKPSEEWENQTGMKHWNTDYDCYQDEYVEWLEKRYTDLVRFISDLKKKNLIGQVFDIKLD